ncbi:MAG: aminotransferase class V-fold PLP-dependent enzyme, partial [Planctomycetota bacterium]
NTISHFLDEGLPAEFGWQGTRDITAWLGAADAIRFMDRTLGWDRIRRHNHELAVWVQALWCRRWGGEPATPLDGSMLGSMVTVPLPPQGPQRFEKPEALQARLFEAHRIEIPVIDWGGRWWIRASCQVYNTTDQYEQAADAVTELLAC